MDKQERDSIIRDANRWLERAKAGCSDFDKIVFGAESKIRRLYRQRHLETH